MANLKKYLVKKENDLISITNNENQTVWTACKGNCWEIFTIKKQCYFYSWNTNDNYCTMQIVDFIKKTTQHHFFSQLDKEFWELTTKKQALELLDVIN